jgi:hypothetical protein
MANQEKVGYFLPTTEIFDLETLKETGVNSSDFKELLVRLHQYINNIALATNAKDTGYYLNQEFVPGTLYFGVTSNALRPVFRKVVDIGAVGAGITTKAHGLTVGATWSFVHIYGCGSNVVPADYLPFPNIDIGVRVDATNIVITNNSGLTFTTCTIVLEYLKQ